MSANNYKDYIALLKSREAQPSFERTKAIIESRDNESAAYVAPGSQTRNWAMGIAALVLLALLARTTIIDSPKMNLATKTSPAATNTNTNSQTVDENDHSPSKTLLRGVPDGRRSNPLSFSAISKDCFVTHPGFLAMTGNVGPISVDSQKSNIATEENPSAALVTSVPPRPIIIECEACNVIPITLSQIALPGTDEQTANRFFVTLNGSLSQELNSIAANNRSSFDAFIGGGYIISPHLSIGLTGGDETFVMKQPNYSTSFTNEQFVHDGVVYPSLIGHIDTGSTPQTEQVYSIGANMRYTFIENTLSPYAEIMGGGSTEGVIAGATIGLSIFHFDFFSIDAGAFIRSLFSPTSSPFTKLGVSLDLRYDL